MLTPMSASDFDRIRELKMTAKWSTDGDEKKNAISELLQYGDKGFWLYKKCFLSLLMMT